MKLSSTQAVLTNDECWRIHTKTCNKNIRENSCLWYIPENTVPQSALAAHFHNSLFGWIFEIINFASNFRWCCYSPTRYNGNFLQWMRRFPMSKISIFTHRLAWFTYGKQEEISHISSKTTTKNKGISNSFNLFLLKYWGLRFRSFYFYVYDSAFPFCVKYRVGAEELSPTNLGFMLNAPPFDISYSNFGKLAPVV